MARPPCDIYRLSLIHICFSFDKGADGTAISRYPLTVTGEETEPVTVTAYNVRLQGALSVQKLVQNADGSPLSEAQKQQAFVFDVTVSDGGTYTYSIDNGEPQLLTSGEMCIRDREYGCGYGHQ